MATNKTDSSILDTTKGVVLVFTLGAVLVAVAGYLPQYFFKPVSSANEFGDSYGFINAVVSGLALAGVLLTLHLQRKELAEQREQLTRSATAQENSERAMAINNVSSLVMALANAQSTLETLSSKANDDSTALQQYLTVLSHARQIEAILIAQRSYLKERAYGGVVSENDNYADVFGPLLNLLPISANETEEEWYEDPDLDFHFFLSTFVDAASKTDLFINHNTYHLMHRIRSIVDETADSKIVRFKQRKTLRECFARLFEGWHLECFDVGPHEFKDRQVVD